jgi:4-carboxymuconolactone decarboxylase
MTARIPPPDPASLPEEIREMLAALPDLSHFTLLAHAPGTFLPRLAYGEALMTTLALPDTVKELAIVRAATLAGCPYVQVQHVAAGRRAGVPDAKLAAASAPEPDLSGFEHGEAAALRFVDEMLLRCGAGAAAVAEVLTCFDARQLVELALVVDRYYGLALVLNSLGLEAEAPRELPPVLR